MAVSRSSNSGPRPLAVQGYVIAAMFLGASALYGGMMLMRDPGEPLGMPIELLEDTPFSDYFVPGVILFNVFGIGSILVIIGLLRRDPWAGIAAIGLGAAQVVWIVVQAFYLRTIHPLHVIYGSLGALLMGLATRPSLRSWLDQ